MRRYNPPEIPQHFQHDRRRSPVNGNWWHHKYLHMDVRRHRFTQGWLHNISMLFVKTSVIFTRTPTTACCQIELFCIVGGLIDVSETLRCIASSLPYVVPLRQTLWNSSMLLPLLLRWCWCVVMTMWRNQFHQRGVEWRCDLCCSNNFSSGDGPLDHSDCNAKIYTTTRNVAA